MGAEKVKVIVNLKGREKEFRNNAIELIRRFQNDVGKKWFWSTTHRNPYAPCINSEMVLEYNSQKPFPQQNGCWKPLNTSNGFGIQLTETISGFMQGA
ncbi:translation initiation factor IF-3, putative [Medicago truncatula]|uniref:Translation initiation factor IF-3, putative n=1 Tax=Medicago truncatula TaxID=3880 RepID=A0A072TY32_MEDTR|nr:translation initiation factor IF-3, putative [Medicago truncatula]